MIDVRIPGVPKEVAKDRSECLVRSISRLIINNLSGVTFPETLRLTVKAEVVGDDGYIYETKAKLCREDSVFRKYNLKKAKKEAKNG